MKQFNLKEYLRLKKKNKEPRIITRDDKGVRILCTDRQSADGYIVALIKDGEREIIRHYYENGNLYRLAIDDLDLFFADLDEEPRYRPFENGAEFIEAQKEKGLYIYFKGTCVHKIPTGINRDTIAVLWDSSKVEKISFEDLLAKATWIDGSPCGVKED